MAIAEQLSGSYADGVRFVGLGSLADPDLYNRNTTEFARMTGLLDTLRAEKDAAEERWLALAELVEG